MITPKKFALLTHYFDPARLQNCNIVDVGGVRSFYGFLEPIFGHNLTILNADRASVCGTAGIVAEATQLPFFDKSLDIVMSFDLIEHLIDPDDFMLEVRRVLKRRGYFIISTPNLADIYSRIALLFGYTPFFYNPSKFGVGAPPKTKLQNIGHKSVFTYKAMKGLLKINNFCIINSLGYSYADIFASPRYRDKSVGFFRLRQVLDTLIPTSLSEDLLFVCQKEGE